MTSKIQTLDEMLAEDARVFANPHQTDEAYQAQRLRDKAKHDREMLTCPIDTTESDADDEDETDAEID